MKHLTLSDYHRKNQYRFIALAAFVSLALAGLSNSFAQEDQSITLTTNKGSYLPGDTVQVSGIVTGQSSALVAIQVKDSDGNLILIRTLQADQDGNFAVQFKIPPTATSGNSSFGVINHLHNTCLCKIRPQRIWIWRFIVKNKQGSD